MDINFANDGDVITELTKRLLERNQELKDLCAQRDDLLTALQPFTVNADAVSLSKALGHITRDHMHRARDAFRNATHNRGPK